jgi:hypothetical protein
MHIDGRPSVFASVGGASWDAIIGRHRLFDRSESAARRKRRDAVGKSRSDGGNRRNLDTGRGPLTAAVFDDAPTEPIRFPPVA